MGLIKVLLIACTSCGAARCCIALPQIVTKLRGCSESKTCPRSRRMSRQTLNLLLHECCRAFAVRPHRGDSYLARASILPYVAAMRVFGGG